MNLRKNSYPESHYGGFTYIDGTIAFYNRVNALIRPDFTVVDFGCGRGEYVDDPVSYRRNLRILKGKVKKVVGLDVSKQVLSNQAIDESIVIEGENIPLDDASVDLILCDNVLEHLPNPSKFFQECYRVLKPNSYLCIRTPNMWSYVGIASQIIPNRWHQRILASVQEGRNDEDIFPTLYRCNSLRTVRRKLTSEGFVDVVVTGFEAEPAYLSFSKIAYWVGTLHQRFAPQFLKTSIFAFARTGASS